MRTCSSCGEEKRITEFYKNGTGHRADCKECYSITRKVNRKKMMKFINNTKHRTGEENTISVRDWRDALLYFGGCCAYCERKQSRRVKLTKDHVVPVSKGGKTTRSNIIPGCVRCNSSKSDSDLREWYLRQKFYKEARYELILGWCEQWI